jgi:hypothetical protein
VGEQLRRQSAREHEGACYSRTSRSFSATRQTTSRSARTSYMTWCASSSTLEGLRVEHSQGKVSRGPRGRHCRISQRRAPQGGSGAAAAQLLAHPARLAS